MTISSDIRSITNFEIKKTFTDKNGLRPGTRLQGTILKLSDAGRALIDFGKFRISAEVKFPVKQQERLIFRVTKSEGRLSLVVEDPQGKSPQDSRQIIHRSHVLPSAKLETLPQLLKEVLTNIQEGQKPPNELQDSVLKMNAYFEPLRLDGSIPELISHLKFLVEESGLFFEKRIEKLIFHLLKTTHKASSVDFRDHPGLKEIFNHDLKSHLTRLLQMLSSGSSVLKSMDERTLDKLQVCVGRLFENIDLQQNHAGERSALNESNQVFHFVLPLKDNPKHGRLKMYFPRDKHGTNRRGFRASLLLSMDHLGEFRTDLHLYERNLSISFFVENESIQEIFEQNMQDLQRLLDPIFNSLQIKSLVSPKKIVQFETEDRHIITESMVDVKA